MDIPKIVAVDFDGTIVFHDYPEIKEEVPGAIATLHDLEDHGAKIILWTMRSGEPLEAAVKFLEDRGVKLWGINENPQQVKDGWSTSPKAYAQMYIDDAALGCPLAEGKHHRLYVDWRIIRSHLGLKPTSA